MHFPSVHVFVAVFSVFVRCTGYIGQIELHVHLHAEGIVGGNVAGTVVVVGILGVVAEVRHTFVLTVHTGVIVVANGFAVGIGVGGVEGQEVRAVLRVQRVTGGFQILIDVETSVTAVIGSCVAEGIIEIISVVFVTGGIYVLEQMVRSAHIGLADDSLAGLGIQRVIRAEEDFS